jgi:hypothetical protein
MTVVYIGILFICAAFIYSFIDAYIRVYHKDKQRHKATVYHYRSGKCPVCESLESCNCKTYANTERYR